MFVNNWNKEIGQTCIKCGLGRLKMKKSKYGTFLGCSHYPDCNYTTNNIEENDDFIREFRKLIK